MISAGVAEAVYAELAGEASSGRGLRKRAMELLAGLAGYDWCGVYRLDGDVLRLDEYVGAETDHTEIPVGRGVCGTAVAEDRSQIVADVRELSNYLSCSAQTRSEIVVLIRDGDVVRGQIDVDGHTVGAFDASDEAFLERVADVLARRWE